MAKIKIVTATYARNNFFELLNEVREKGESIEIKKDRKTIARLVPDNGERKISAQELIKKTEGALWDTDIEMSKNTPMKTTYRFKFHKRLWKK